MKKLSECRLYAFIDTAYLHGRSAVEIATELCDGGADLIQVRAKQSSVAEVRELAETILPITRSAEVGLVINDFPEIASAVGAEFAHLGQDDFFGRGYRHVSELLKGTPRPGIGLSGHSPSEAKRTLSAGADYLGVGPIYPTATKAEAKPVGLEYVRWAAANISVPWFAIGGISLENVDEVVAAGARGICVVSAILNSPDIAAACRAFRTRLP